MQTVVQQFGGVWAEILGWAAVLGGLAILTALVALAARRRARRNARIAETAARLEPGREWELVMRRATEDLWRGPELAALQADALLRIESAEHAYNRLVVDCARLCEIPVAPTLEPERQPTGEPDEAPERQPLAA